MLVLWSVVALKTRGCDSKFSGSATAALLRRIRPRGGRRGACGADLPWHVLSGEGHHGLKTRRCGGSDDAEWPCGSHRIGDVIWYGLRVDEVNAMYASSGLFVSHSPSLHASITQR